MLEKFWFFLFKRTNPRLITERTLQTSSEPDHRHSTNQTSLSKQKTGQTSQTICTTQTRNRVSDSFVRALPNDCEQHYLVFKGALRVLPEGSQGEFYHVVFASSRGLFNSFFSLVFGFPTGDEWNLTTVLLPCQGQIEKYFKKVFQGTCRGFRRASNNLF